MPDSWDRIAELFETALSLPPERRPGFLDQACSGEDALREQVEELLKNHDAAEANSFLGQPPAANRMSLAPGTELGHYQLVDLLGAGGMGEVYRARDTKLDREIAIKVLPDELTENHERLGRFEREAKALAALDHPNIVTVHSIEEDQGTPFITMQLVRGRNLSELIAHKGLPLKQFFEIAIPLADAVSSAHEQGITHRDLKPDNLMVSDKGQLKILDFGLAILGQGRRKVVGSDAPTVTKTEAGRIVGTAAYMSPEQAEGKRVDHRSDMFSIGSILYEMLTGEKPFKGESQASILSSILRDTPASVTTLNSDCPRELSRIVKRCLVKDPDDRYQSAKDLRNELKEIKQELDSGDLLEPARVDSPIQRSWILLAGVGVVAVGAALVGYFLRPGDSIPEGTEAPRVTSSFSQLTSHPAREFFPSLSPDGNWFAYAGDASGDWDIYLQSVGGERAINLTEGIQEDDTQPAFSPDGEQIVFRSERDGGGLFVMGRTGESVKRVADFGHNPAWAPDGKRIVCATGATVNTRGRAPSEAWVIDTTTGEKKLLADVDAAQPHWSPHGNRIAYWSILGGAEIWTMPADGGEPVRVTEDGYFDWNPVWSPDGAYLYFSSDRGGSQNLWRVAINEESGNVQGPPEPVTSGVASHAVHLSLSASGRKVAYVAQVVASNIHKMNFDPSSGEVQGELVPVTEGSENIDDIEPSPDGEWLAYTTSGKQEDLSSSKRMEVTYVS